MNKNGFVVRNTVTGLYASRSQGIWVSRLEDAMRFDFKASAQFAADAASLFCEEECVVEVV